MHRSRIFPILAVLLLIQPLTALAETVNVPLKLDYRILRQVLISELFTGPGQTASLVEDPSGCNQIVLSDPKLGHHAGDLDLDGRLSARLGVGGVGSCSIMMEWQGRVKLLGRPVLVSTPGPKLRFEMDDVQLYDEEGDSLGTGLLLGYVRRGLEVFLSGYQVDFAPSLNELRRVLPSFLPRQSAVQLNRMLDSLEFRNLRIEDDGVHLELGLQIEPALLPPRKREPVLTENELRSWQDSWHSMDAFLTLMVKQGAASTELQPLRDALFDILLDARYRLKEVLSETHPGEEDPLQRWFFDSWQQVAEVSRQIGEASPGKEPLTLVTLLTAADALEAINRLGPAVGLELSVDGLRRLARLLSDVTGDPLQYREEVDPELRRLFQFEVLPDDEPVPSPQSNWWLIRPARAEPASPRLNRWAPKADELDEYLPLVRSLLLDTAEHEARPAALDADVAQLYRFLVLATAWQESCWRQFVVERGKLAPLRSASGDIGIMQVNERVWRGFYDIDKLRWDITYNARAGGEILRKYLTSHALKRGEHKRAGGIDNLARAAYSAYNGGPGQVARYRSTSAPRREKEIDQAFWDKYRRVKQGHELQVAQCLSSTDPASSYTPARSEPEQPKPAATPTPSPVHSGGSHDNRWVRAQNKDQFTLQLAVFSSREAALAFVAEQRLKGDTAIYVLRDGNFGVAHGRFADRAAAERAGKGLKGLKPWPRPFGDIQKLLGR